MMRPRKNTVLACMLTAAAITVAPLAQGAYVAYTPGSGYADNIPAAVAGAGLVSNGELTHLATAPGMNTFLNVNPEQYAGQLGLGNTPGTVSGRESVRGGAQAIVDYVITATGGDTSANVVTVSGSLGTLASAVAMAQLAELGYTNIWGIGFSGPRGFLERFDKRTPVLWFGLDPGAPPQAEVGNFLEVVNEFDPMFRTSKFVLDPFLIPNFVLGFMMYHGAIMDIDYLHPDNVVEVDGNVTRVILHNKWVPLLAPLASMLEQTGMNTDWLTPFDDVLRGMMRLGLESEGTFQLMPSPGQMVQGLRYTLEGFVMAIKHTAQLLTGQPLSPRNEGAAPLDGSPVTGIIDEIIGQEAAAQAVASDTSEVVYTELETGDNDVAQQQVPQEEELAPSPAEEPVVESTVPLVEAPLEAQAPSSEPLAAATSAPQTAKAEPSDVIDDDVTDIDRKPVSEDDDTPKKESKSEDDKPTSLSTKQDEGNKDDRSTRSEPSSSVSNSGDDAS